MSGSGVRVVPLILRSLTFVHEGASSLLKG